MEQFIVVETTVRIVTVSAENEEAAKIKGYTDNRPHDWQTTSVQSKVFPRHFK